MGVLAAVKKGLDVAGKSLLLCLVCSAILLIGYIIIGFLLGGVIISSNFPPITPNMTPDQVSALNWGQVNWAMFIPAVIVILAIGFLLNAFVQSGMLGVIKDGIVSGKQNIGNFFKYASKFFMRIFLQLLIVTILTIIVVVIGIIVITVAGLINIQSVTAILAGIVLVVLIAALVYIAMMLIYGQISLVSNNGKAMGSLGEGRRLVNKNLVKTLLLFLFTGAIYLAVYFIIQGLSQLTMAWPVALQVIWGVITIFIYLVASVLMLGSFIAMYIVLAGKPQAGEKVF